MAHLLAFLALAAWTAPFAGSASNACRSDTTPHLLVDFVPGIELIEISHGDIGAEDPNITDSTYAWTETSNT